MASTHFPRMCSTHATSQNYPYLIDYPSDIRSVLPETAQAAVEFDEFCALSGFAKSPQGVLLERVFYTPPGSAVKLFTGTYVEVVDARDNNLPVPVEKFIANWLVGGRAGIASPLAKVPILKHLVELFAKAEQASLPTWAPQRCAFSFPHEDGRIYYFLFNPDRDPVEGTSSMRFVTPEHPEAAGVAPCMFFPEVINDEIIMCVLESPLFPGCVDPRFPDVHVNMANNQNQPHWWDELPSFATPVLRKVMTDQFCGGQAERNDPEHPMLVIAVVCAMMGRWVRPVNTTDLWAKLMYLIGDGGTGKSLLFAAMRRWLPSHRIANLSARMEKQFGLDGFQHAWAVLGDELRGEIGIAPTALLSMTTGDTVKIAVKNGKAVDKAKWDAAIVAGGNEMVAEFVDVKGSWQRRLLIVTLNVTIDAERRDERLKADVAKEAGFILLKCAAAYRATIDWLMLTGTQFDNFIDRSWFTAQAADLLESKAKVDEFLDQGPLVFDMVQKETPQATRIYMPIEELGKTYRHWCSRRGYVVRGPWNGSVYGNPFNARNLVVPRDNNGVLNANKDWPAGSGLSRNTVYVLGVDLAEDASRDDVPDYLHDKLDLLPKHRSNVFSAVAAARLWRQRRRQKRERDAAAANDGAADATAAAAAVAVGNRAGQSAPAAVSAAKQPARRA
jgi:hypothetical protein